MVKLSAVRCWLRSRHVVRAPSAQKKSGPREGHGQHDIQSRLEIGGVCRLTT
jgi:hypothetical protein